MNRIKKQIIRNQINNILDKECKGCQYNGKNMNSVCNKECPVGAKMQKLSKALFQDEKKQVSMFDPALDFESFKRLPWTIEDDYYLLNHAEIYSSVHLAKRLGRTPIAVQNRLILLRRRQKKEAAVQ